MKFSKFNNPAKRRKVRRSTRNVIEQRNELCELLGTAKTEMNRDLLIDAYNVTVCPTQTGRGRRRI